MVCTRCDATGFLNVGQLPGNMVLAYEDGDLERILTWIIDNDNHDVSVCDCCGDGKVWYGTPGEHYGSGDPQGERGPYAYNGGLAECH